MKSFSRRSIVPLGVIAFAVALLAEFQSINHAAALADDTTTATTASSMPKELLGHWIVSYHPNQAVRRYEFRPDLTAVLTDQTGWSGSLTPYVDPTTLQNVPARWKLTFDGDTENRFELITWTADGRLLVEHYNPTATPLPGFDQVGIGVRPTPLPKTKDDVGAGSPDEKR